MNKKKEQQLKELENKYFWEQKTKEILMFILIIAGFILCWYMVSEIILELSPEGVCWKEKNINCDKSILGTGFLGLIIFTFISLILWGVFALFKLTIIYWIESNEEEARKRAKKELGIKEKYGVDW